METQGERGWWRGGEGEIVYVRERGGLEGDRDGVRKGENER